MFHGKDRGDLLVERLIPGVEIVFSLPGDGIDASSRASDNQMGANRVRGNPQYGVQLQPIDFVAFACACGMAGLYRSDQKLAGRPKRRVCVSRSGGGGSRRRSNEPPLPGKIMTKQSWHFAKALAKVQKDCWEIIKMVVEDKICEVV